MLEQLDSSLRHLHPSAALDYVPEPAPSWLQNIIRGLWRAVVSKATFQNFPLDPIKGAISAFVDMLKWFSSIYSIIASYNAPTRQLKDYPSSTTRRQNEEGKLLTQSLH